MLSSRTGLYFTLALALIFAYAMHLAWLNGAFLRCPGCRKIGVWRFDDLAPAEETQDEDGCLESTRQKRRCSRCGIAVLERWSDREGRRLEKSDSP